MKDRTFWILFLSVVGICLCLTLAHLIWAIFAYQSSSIITFIAGELW